AGHNPGLQELIFELVAPERENELFAAATEKYPTAAFAVLELEIERWADCTPSCGTLVHLARPRDLDPALGPAASEAGLRPGSDWPLCVNTAPVTSPLASSVVKTT